MPNPPPPSLRAHAVTRPRLARPGSDTHGAPAIAPAEVGEGKPGRWETGVHGGRIVHHAESHNRTDPGSALLRRRWARHQAGEPLTPLPSDVDPKD